MFKKVNKTQIESIPIVRVKKSIGQRVVTELSQNKYLYIMALPVIIYYAIFCYGPMYGLIIAFKDYTPATGILGSDWVGFKHFIAFFQNTYFWRLMKNTFLLSFYDLLWGFPAPIIFALLLNEIRHSRFKVTVQTITYLPHFISLIVACGMVIDFVSEGGVITQILTLFGGEAKNYLGDARYFRTVYIASNIWQDIGWGSIIYLAALSGIDQELYEAATIDGAGRLKQTLHITLPGLLPTIMVLFIMKVGQMMSLGFEKIILLYNPLTYETADVIASFVYREGLGQGVRYSYSTAVGLFQSVINLIFLLSANWLSKKFTESSLF